MGNYKHVASFLTHTPASDKPLAINLLKQLPDYHLQDITEDVLTDHLTNVIRFEKTHGAYDYELYSQYVLNPSIRGYFFAWRKYLYESLPAQFRQDATNDPSILITYVKNNIVLADDETRESYYWVPRISPKGVHELKVADSSSRDMYFVALCRSLGIPARVEGRGDDKRPQFYFNNEWHDVWFAERSQPVPGKGFIRFSSDEKDPAPEYYTDFAIGRFQNGRYDIVMLAFSKKSRFPDDEVALAPGCYMLLTGNRVNDSKILATLSFFELKEDEHKAIDIKLRRWSRDTTGLNLFIAAWSGDLPTAKRLTQEESDVDRKDEWGWTALYWAMRGKQKEVAEFLIAEGANVNIKGEKDLTPLHLAITNNQKELIETLIARGADVNAKGEKDQTPLHLAIEHNQKKLAETLIAKGADVNAKDNWNWTLLHGAIYSSKDTTEIKAMVELLIARGANVNSRDGDNRTPLWYARKEGYSEIVELLKKHGAKE
jgi:ankyrin repeat protein